MLLSSDVAAVRAALAACPGLGQPPASLGVPEPVPVDIVVPIYNAIEEVVACLLSVARHTRAPARLVLLNDGSTDVRVSQLLQGLRDASPQLVVVDRSANRGFVHTINEGFGLSSVNDVVILNTDTVVSRDWLDKLTAVARLRPNVATVTPLTNNGTICSVPEPLEVNEIPIGYDIDSFAALVEARSLHLFPEAPTGVGFCMFVSRRALTALGGFDATTFGAGYGEENDFCQRAIHAGFVNLIADDTYVYHVGRSSFGDRAEALIERNLATVIERYPDYENQVAHFCANHPLRPFHARLRGDIAVRRGSSQRLAVRVLHILHHGGGTEKHARELAEIDDRCIVSYVLVSDGRTLDVDEYFEGRKRRSFRFPLPGWLGPYGPLRDSAYRDALATICRVLDINLIHIHHLRHNALDVADVAASQGIPYVMTLHDYHTICPSYTLLAPDGNPCGACLEPTADGSVAACMTQAGKPAAYLSEYQTEMERFLCGASRLFVPNPRARDIIAARYPRVATAITVVEHGTRESASVQRPGRRPSPDLTSRSLNVAVMGGLETHKGLKVFRNLLRENRRSATTFHLYGTADDPAISRLPMRRAVRLDGSTMVFHGPYDSRNIVETLVRDRVDVGLQLSVWPETFSFTLSEFAAAGVPVIAGSLGAQGERVERCRLGWTIPDIRDVQAILRILDDVGNSRQMLADVAAGMRREEALIPMQVMWRQYGGIYHPLAGSTPREPTADAAATLEIALLASRLASAALREQEADRLKAELAALKERMRSPRYWVADRLGNTLQKMPILWPVVSSLTDFLLRRARRAPRS